MLCRISLILFFLQLFAPSFATPIAKRGVLDLSKVDLQDERVALDGEWEFYWGKLLLSGQFGALGYQDFFGFPQLWNGSSTYLGTQLSSRGFGTYRLRLILPEEAHTAFYIKHFYCAYALYVDGRLVAENGKVATDDKQYEPSWIPTKFELPPTSDTVELVLQIANFSHRKGGAREPILVADKKRMDAEINQVFGFDLLLAGSLIMAGLFFLGLFGFGNRQRYILYFGLFCLTFSYRVISADDYVLHMLYPQIDWRFAINAEYISLFIPLSFFALYTDSLFPKDSKYFLLKIQAGLGALLTFVVFMTPPTVFTTLVGVYLVMLFSGILFSGWVYYQAYRYNRDGARFALLSSAVVLCVFFYKMLDYMGIIREYEVVSFVGYVFFFFFQSLILFFLLTNSLRSAKEEAELASRSKSDFLSMMSHEIRTPMNAVIGLTNYLLQESPKDSQVDMLNTLSFSAKNLLVIINDILDFSKIEAKKIVFDPQPVDLRDLIERLERVFRPTVEEKHLQLLINVDPQLPRYLNCDPTRTSQILTNLINNAVKFTEHGAIEVSLAVEKISGDQVDVNFSVRDTGIGIRKDKLSDIFKSFTQASSSTTRKFGGTGLGLTITKNLLQLQGSDLMVESEYGRGSIFYFVLQMKVAGVVNLENVSSGGSTEDKQDQLNIKILIVEDNAVNVLVVRKFLKKWGVASDVAKNGKEAIEKYFSSPDFDLILMDLQMPVMDGFAAAKILRLKGVEVPIIALTASILTEDRDKIEDAGMDDFVLKPFDPDFLYSVLKKHIGSKD